MYTYIVVIENIQWRANKHNLLDPYHIVTTSMLLGLQKSGISA